MTKASSNNRNFNTRKLYIDKFNSMCGTRNRWDVWSDFIVATACAISNTTNQDKNTFKEREEEYKECIDRLGVVDNCAELLAYVVCALEENPKQDFLGSLFMELKLGDNRKGQFFTPYSICKLMAELTESQTSSIKQEIDLNGWAAVNDPACGAGATLIALANLLKEHDINYQENTLFVAQDLDRIVGLMCYIQLSLLGCAGCVVIADTLRNPFTSELLFPYPKEEQEIWCTPMFSSPVWNERRACNYIDKFLKR